MKISKRLIGTFSGIIVGLIIFCSFAYYWQTKQSEELLAKEYSNYIDYDTKLKDAAEKITTNMTRNDVERIVRVPPGDFFFDDENDRVTWHWNSYDQIGEIHKRQGLSSVKGHFNLSVIFNSEGRVEKIYKGID